jgi:hypothetical protein
MAIIPKVTALSTCNPRDSKMTEVNAKTIPAHQLRGEKKTLFFEITSREYAKEKA